MTLQQNGKSQQIHLQGQAIGASSRRITWMFKNMSYVKVFTKYSQAKLVLGRVNLELSKLDYNDPLYMQRLNEFNTIMLECSKARWHASVATVTRARNDWRRSLNTFRVCIKHGKPLLKQQVIPSPYVTYRFEN